MKYSIKQVSEITGFPSSTLRYYESEKILPPVKRNENGIRTYDEYDVEWISVISCLKNTNMPMDSIKRFVKLSMKGDVTLKERLEMVLEHKNDILAQIEQLKVYLEQINFKAEYYKRACDAGTEQSVKYMYRDRNENKNEK